MKTVFTNGCFDILGIHHLRYLQAAARLGQYLIIGLNSDESVRKLKGKDRPINCQAHRQEILEALYFVTEVIIFDEPTNCKLMRQQKPDIFCKGGDYTLETLNPDEVALCRELEIEIVFIPKQEGRSTTETIQKMK